MKSEKSYGNMNRKELRQCLNAARESKEEERKILDSAEVFSSDYEKKQKQYRKAYEEIETIKKEIYKRNTKLVIIGIILLLLIIGTQQFLHKVNIRKWQSSEGEVLLVSWWPGVDFSFKVYEDHICIDDSNTSNVEHITIPKTIWFRPVTEIDSSYFFSYNYDSKSLRSLSNTEKIVLADNIDNIKNEDGWITCIRENLLRWGEEGIAAYLTDVGVEDVEAAKEQLAFKEDEISEFIAIYFEGYKTKEEVKEEVRKAFDIMINGGDIAQIPDFVYTRVKKEINTKIRYLLEPSYDLDSWLRSNNE